MMTESANIVYQCHSTWGKSVWKLASYRLLHSLITTASGWWTCFNLKSIKTKWSKCSCIFGHCLYKYGNVGQQTFIRKSHTWWWVWRHQTKRAWQCEGTSTCLCFTPTSRTPQWTCFLGSATFLSFCLVFSLSWSQYPFTLRSVLVWVKTALTAPLFTELVHFQPGNFKPCGFLWCSTCASNCSV